MHYASHEMVEFLRILKPDREEGFPRGGAVREAIPAPFDVSRNRSPAGRDSWRLKKRVPCSFPFGSFIVVKNHFSFVFVSTQDTYYPLGSSSSCR